MLFGDFKKCVFQSNCINVKNYCKYTEFYESHIVGCIGRCDWLFVILCINSLICHNDLNEVMHISWFVNVRRKTGSEWGGNSLTGWQWCQGIAGAAA